MADIKCILGRIQVQHRGIRGDFECIHVPSIDPSSLSTTATGEESRRTIVRKGSRLSFGKKGERDEKRPVPPPIVQPDEKKSTVENKKPEDREKDKEDQSSLSSSSLAGSDVYHLPVGLSFVVAGRPSAIE
ncbi:hypothetical protein RhiTH_009851 [Rhizoctonia solani]